MTKESYSKSLCQTPTIREAPPSTGEASWNTLGPTKAEVLKSLLAAEGRVRRAEWRWERCESLAGCGSSGAAVLGARSHARRGRRLRISRECGDVEPPGGSPGLKARSHPNVPEQMRPSSEKLVRLKPHTQSSIFSWQTRLPVDGFTPALGESPQGAPEMQRGKGDSGSCSRLRTFGEDHGPEEAGR